MTQEEAYNQIAQLGRQHALINEAAGGVIIIVHPEIQIEAGIQEHCRRMAGWPIPNQGKPNASI